MGIPRAPLIPYGQFEVLLLSLSCTGADAGSCGSCLMAPPTGPEVPTTNDESSSRSPSVFPFWNLYFCQKGNDREANPFLICSLVKSKYKINRGPKKRIL